ncbi:hypothetical protein LMH87_010355 [Akanthomyces muscarius]|uniref:Uncharacterized protein n=1 Tax=Akanthomyces muscarius TaxID=2231603 RepID=A0A9W8QD51_AKAMU|nr:hypothetical protein LMH87_010355 [Akanthomyces muscarius]KAJ4153888.1 hypothetical protein LMH87_010355 [Akanthomyces muscarius]
MHYNMNYAYDFQATKLVHRPGKTSVTNLKPPKPKAASHKRGLDPEELTRRLQFVIAERKAHDEKKRRPRVAASSSKPFRSTQETSSEVKSLRRRTAALDSPKDKRPSKGSHHQAENSLAARFRRRASRAALDEQQSADPAASDGPYVPRVAASQFADTTIGDSPPDKSHIHKLSRAALKYHMDGVNGDFQVASTAVPGAAPIEQAKALRRAQTLRERNYDRNQFQASSMPEDLDPAIMFRRRSIFTAHNPEEKQLRASRRKSTGSVLGDDSSLRNPVFLPPMNPTDLAAVAEAHRVDWTQSDEPAATSPPPRPKSASPAQSTKGESKWKLRGRLNSFHRNKEEKSPSPPADNVEVPKSPIASLFARFRR